MTRKIELVIVDDEENSMGLTVIADDEEDRTNRRKEIAQGDASFNNFLSSDVGGRGAVVSTQRMGLKTPAWRDDVISCAATWTAVYLRPLPPSLSCFSN
ncbi:hypothetical protein U1Q18_001039 [Sarracenia purpurea var. burkii]